MNKIIYDHLTLKLVSFLRSVQIQMRFPEETGTQLCDCDAAATMWRKDTQSDFMTSANLQPWSSRKRNRFGLLFLSFQSIQTFQQFFPSPHKILIHRIINFTTV